MEIKGQKKSQIPSKTPLPAPQKSAKECECKYNLSGVC